MLITLASNKGGIGKTTSAIHLAAYLSAKGTTLLIDGDPNRSALKWSHRGNLPFKVVSLMESPKHAGKFEHVVFDTQARPSQDDLESLVEGCDLLIVPVSPDIMGIEASLDTVEVLAGMGSDRHRLLLTMVPPTRKTGQQTREALADYPLFKHQIRRYAAYEKAALVGVLVQESGDRNGRIAWSDYEKVGKEIIH